MQRAEEQELMAKFFLPAQRIPKERERDRHDKSQPRRRSYARGRPFAASYTDGCHITARSRKRTARPRCTETVMVLQQMISR